MLRSNCLTGHVLLLPELGAMFYFISASSFLFHRLFSSFVFIVHRFMNYRVSKWSYEWVSYLKIVIWSSNVYCCTQEVLCIVRNQRFVCETSWYCVCFFAMFCRCYGLMQRSGCCQSSVHSVQEFWHLANINIQLQRILLQMKRRLCRHGVSGSVLSITVMQCMQS